jgi:7,8-dihydropterin-6-yl-methyl-4-(beta-D-ribofuranosyl)aminobenzene 5'-phosphate synthase
VQGIGHRRRRPRRDAAPGRGQRGRPDRIGAGGRRLTTLVDNVYDALLTGDNTITRAPLAAGTAQAPQFEPGFTNVGLMAEHGFSALVTVRRGDTTTSVLFDTGLSPDAMVTNADRLGLDLSGVHAVVLSHGHFDHVGGLAGLAGRRGTRSLPMVVHPLVWTRRRLARPGGGADDWPTLSKRALTGEGFDVIERRQPSLLVDGSILITGEVDRTTDFEHGMPPAHQHWTGTTWEPDPLIHPTAGSKAAAAPATSSPLKSGRSADEGLHRC